STGSIVTLTTGAITYNNTSAATRAQTALDIQNALIGLNNIGGIGGSVTVTVSAKKGTSFTVTFLGSLQLTNVQQLTSSPGAPPPLPSAPCPRGTLASPGAPTPTRPSRPAPSWWTSAAATSSRSASSPSPPPASSRCRKTATSRSRPWRATRSSPPLSTPWWPP